MGLRLGSPASPDLGDALPTTLRSTLYEVRHQVVPNPPSDELPARDLLAVTRDRVLVHAPHLPAGPQRGSGSRTFDRAGRQPDSELS